MATTEAPGLALARPSWTGCDAYANASSLVLSSAIITSPMTVGGLLPVATIKVDPDVAFGVLFGDYHWFGIVALDKHLENSENIDI